MTCSHFQCKEERQRPNVSSAFVAMTSVPQPIAVNMFLKFENMKGPDPRVRD